MTASAPPYEDEVITVMTGVDTSMTGAGVVNHNGEVISRAMQAIDHNGAVMAMTDMVGSVMAGTATVDL